MVNTKKLTDVNYKGYAIKFVEKMMAPGQKVVQANFASKISGRALGDIGATKADAEMKVKRIIDKELKIKGL